MSNLVSLLSIISKREKELLGWLIDFSLELKLLIELVFWVDYKLP